MTRYILPPVLGGDTAEGTPTSFAGEQYRSFDIGGVHFYVRLDALTEVKPTLPTKPGIYADKDGYPWRFDGDAWWLGGGSAAAPAEVALRLPLIRLVPALEPVSLPWGAACCAGSGDAGRVEIRPADSDGEIAVCLYGVGTAYIDREDARQAGRALLTAAGDLP